MELRSAMNARCWDVLEMHEVVDGIWMADKLRCSIPGCRKSFKVTPRGHAILKHELIHQKGETS